CGKNPAIGDVAHVVVDRLLHIGEGTDHSVGRRSRSAPDWRRTLRFSTPTALQLMEGGVEFPPLAAREEAPLERVLKPVIILAGFSACDFGPGARDIKPIEHVMMPGPIVSAFANEIVQATPIVHVYVVKPAV